MPYQSLISPATQHFFFLRIDQNLISWNLIGVPRKIQLLIGSITVWISILHEHPASSLHVIAGMMGSAFISGKEENNCFISHYTGLPVLKIIPKPRKIESTFIVQ